MSWMHGRLRFFISPISTGGLENLRHRCKFVVGGGGAGGILPQKIFWNLRGSEMVFSTFSRKVWGWGGPTPSPPGLPSLNPWPFELGEVNVCFVRGPLRWLTAARNTNVSWLLNFRVHIFLESAVIAENNNRLCFAFSLISLYTCKWRDYLFCVSLQEYLMNNNPLWP